MSALNAWLNPFSSDYRAAVSDFDKIDGPKQVLVVAVSLLCGVAFLVGGVAAFRGMVTWLKPGDSQGADKVDDLVHSKRPFHPAETPSDSEDRLSSLPAEVLTLIAGNLDNQSLRRLGVTSKDLLDNSGEGYKKEVKQLLGATLATEMRQRRSSWREVLLDFRRPFQPSLGSLSVLGVEDSGWGDKPVLNAVLDAIRKNDEGALDRNLQQLQREGNLNQLNSRYFGKTALEVAAINGHVKMAEILISYGAKDALGGKHYNSSHGVKGYSALFWAAHKGRIEMVRFLLDKGASPSWILEQDGFDRPFLEKLVGEQRDESYDVLECILLLVNAWKGASGSEVVSEDKSAIQAFNGAINRGHADTARLLYALGIRPEISREMIDKIVLRSLQTKNLTMIKFLHEYNLVDFKILRSSSGETLLHQAYAVAAMDILQYLID
ncbi:MAG: ankyrin repeat domain-containing protein, partial [Chlamydiia bacterium]|nr:ankyrin repeat domain-containing protein [Chlamydiia bacterium]